MCNLPAARRDFDKILELKPGHKAATESHQELENLDQQMKQVEAQFSSGAALTDPDVQQGIYMQLHSIYDIASDCTRAQLLEIQLLESRAKSTGQQEDWEQLIATTGRLLKSDPSNKEALAVRGVAYFYAGDHDLAKRHFGEALNRDPDYKPAKDGFKKVKDFDNKKKKADAAASERNWEESARLFIEALNVDMHHRKGNVALWRGLADARYHLGRHDEALEAYQAVVNLDPNNEGVKATIVRLLLAAEKWQEAVNRAREFVNQHQQSHELRQMLQEAEVKLKMSTRKDYYKILGVDKSAGEREIKRAYRSLAMVHHPDKHSGGNEEDKRAAEAKFRDIAEAYEVLSDDEKRGRFDRGEDVDQQSQQQQQQNFHNFHNFHGGFHGHQQHFQWG
jgi:DnaJ family protein C protein 3